MNNITIEFWESMIVAAYISTITDGELKVQKEECVYDYDCIAMQLLIQTFEPELYEV